ncbi:MAG: hypothetical protein M0Z95_23320 [Actinomycetota bacterium]|nr:hypothetical protein [Actinomycetota bacterium]
MSDQIVCPNCGIDDHLSGQRRDQIIHITCSACKLEWDRDPSPHCRTCGNHDMRPVPQAVWEKSRGNQLSTVALHTIYLCPNCDAEKIRRHLDSGSPIPPDENPAAGIK